MGLKKYILSFLRKNARDIGQEYLGNWQKKYKTQKFFISLMFCHEDIAHLEITHTQIVQTRPSVFDNYHVLVSLYSYFNKITVIFAYLALQMFTA